MQDELNPLIYELTAALQATRDTLKSCQEQNQRLITGHKFYANQDNWRAFKIHDDAGKTARDLLKKEIGYVR